MPSSGIEKAAYNWFAEAYLGYAAAWPRYASANQLAMPSSGIEKAYYWQCPHSLLVFESLLVYELKASYTSSLRPRY